MKIYIKSDEYDEELDDDQRKWIKDQATMKKDNPAVWPSKDQVHDDIINLLCYNDNYKKYDINLNDIQVKRIKHDSREFLGLYGIEEGALWSLNGDAIILYDGEEHYYWMRYYQCDDNEDYCIFDENIPEKFKNNYKFYSRDMEEKNKQSEMLCEILSYHSEELDSLKNIMKNIKVGDNFDGHVVSEETIGQLNSILYYLDLDKGYDSVSYSEYDYDENGSTSSYILKDICGMKIEYRGNNRYVTIDDFN